MIAIMIGIAFNPHLTRHVRGSMAQVWSIEYIWHIWAHHQYISIFSTPVYPGDVMPPDTIDLSTMFVVRTKH